MPARSHPISPPAIVTGFGSAVAMWCAWYVLHLPGLHASSQATAIFLATLLALGCATGAHIAHHAHARKGWLIGALAGLVAALVNLLLLGNKVVMQPTTTTQMAEQANRLRPDAAAIVLGFLAASTILGTLAGILGAWLPTRHRREPNWFAAFAIVLAVAVLPLIVAGGIVTSTDSGMAVPDSVTTYGSISFLFPLSLMSHPRIFFEHSHRLFGTLIGLSSILLALWACTRRRTWLPSAAAILLLAALLTPFILETTGRTHTEIAIWIIIAIADAILITTAALILNGKIAWAAVGLFLLVTVQGLLGALRVSEVSTILAMYHGVFAQLVFASVAAYAAMAIVIDRPQPQNLPHATKTALKKAAAIGPWVVAAIILQLIFGAGYRHTASHAFLGLHVLFSLAVATLVAVFGLSLLNAESFSEIGGRARRRGKLLVFLVCLQFALGITAISLVLTRNSHRPIPTADELTSAAPLPKIEALFTTAHQATGAALFALTAATWVAVRLHNRRLGSTTNARKSENDATPAPLPAH